MKILQVNKQYYPVVGGVETVVRQLAEAYADRGHDSRVLAARSGTALADRQETLDGVRVHKTGSLGTVANTALSPTFPAVYRSELQRSEIIHFHAPSPLPELTHFLMGAPDDRPVVVTFHCDPAASRFGALNALYEPLQRSLLERADAIVVTAPRNAERPILEGLGHKTTVVPLAADVDRESPSEELVDRVRGRHRLGDRPVILSVGRLVYYKGLDNLIRSVESLSADLVIVGKGPEREALESLVAELGLEDRVDFAGFVEEEMLPAYYTAADLFALPSVSAAEAFGIVQVEAMAHGLPVVNTDLPSGVPFVSRHGETGLTVPPDDVGALRGALERLMEDEEERRRFGEAALRRSEEFTVERMVEEYLDLYSSLLGE